MAVQSRRRKIRRQITLTPAADARLRQLAAQRRVPASVLIEEAIRGLPEVPDQASKVRALKGAVTGGGPGSWGRDVDDLLYSNPPHRHE